MCIGLLFEYDWTPIVGSFSVVTVRDTILYDSLDYVFKFFRLDKVE